MTFQNVLATLIRTLGVTTIVVLAATIGSHSAVHAQEDSVAAAAEQKPIRQLRREMDSAEKAFFSMFNKINGDNDFDTKCKKRATLGSRNKVQVCTPKFLRVYEASLTSGASGSMRWDTPAPTGSRMAAKKELMRKEIDRLLADNESFKKVFQEFADSKRAYEIGMQNQ